MIIPLEPVAEPDTSILPEVPVKVTVESATPPVGIKDIIPVVGAPGATTPEVVGKVYVGIRSIMLDIVAFEVPPPAAGDKGIKSPVAGDLYHR